MQTKILIRKTCAGLETVRLVEGTLLPPDVFPHEIPPSPWLTTIREWILFRFLQALR